MADLALDPDRCLVDLGDGEITTLGTFLAEDTHTLQTTSVRCDICEGTTALVLRSGRFSCRDRSQCNDNARRRNA